MNYSALIQNRKSVREFTEQQVSFTDLEHMKDYYLTAVRRLVPEIETELYFFGTATRAALEGAAGYNDFLVGAPQYLILMSQSHPLAELNAGYVMEDLILKAADLGLDSCWLSFKSSQEIKDVLGIDSPLEVAAIAAFGYGKKTIRRLRLNFLSMSNVDLAAKHRYMEPKRGIQELVSLNTWGNTAGLNEYIGFYDDMLWESLYAASLSPSYLNRQAYGFLLLVSLNTWGNTAGLNEYIGFYDDMLWESLYAASLSPSYLNRQAYGFLLHDGSISLVRRPDVYTNLSDGDLSMGAALYAASLSPSYLNRQAYGFLLHDGSISLVRRPDVYTNLSDGDLSMGAALLHFTSVAENWAGKLNWTFGGSADSLHLPQDHQLVATCKL